MILGIYDLAEFPLRLQSVVVMGICIVFDEDSCTTSIIRFTESFPPEILEEKEEDICVVFLWGKVCWIEIFTSSLNLYTEWQFSQLPPQSWKSCFYRVPFFFGGGRLTNIKGHP